MKNRVNSLISVLWIFSDVVTHITLCRFCCSYCRAASFRLHLLEEQLKLEYTLPHIQKRLRNGIVQNRMKN